MSENSESISVEEVKDVPSSVNGDQNENTDQNAVVEASTSTATLSENPATSSGSSVTAACDIKPKTELGSVTKNNALDVLMREYREAGEEYSSEDSSAESTVSGLELDDMLEGIDDNEEKTDINDKSGLKTKGELSYEDLPPVEELNITVEKELCRPVGTFLHSINSMAVVRGHLNVPPLNVDTVLFLDEGKRPFGKIFDVFGPIHQPYYTVRFNKDDDLTNLQIGTDEIVYCAPQMEYTSYINTAQLIREKGSDASWMDNNEPPPNQVDYSDDEEEANARRQKKVGDDLDPDDQYESDFVSKMNAKNLALTEKRMNELRNGNWSMLQTDQYRKDEKMLERIKQKTGIRVKCRNMIIGEMTGSYFEDEPITYAEQTHHVPQYKMVSHHRVQETRAPRLPSYFRPAITTPPSVPVGAVPKEPYRMHYSTAPSNRMPAYVTPPGQVPRYAFLPITPQYGPSRLNPNMIVDGVYHPTFPPPPAIAPGFYQVVSPRFNPPIQSGQPIRTGYYLSNSALMSAIPPPPPPVTHATTSTTCPTSNEPFGGYGFFPQPDSTTDNFEHLFH